MVATSIVGIGGAVIGGLLEAVMDVLMTSTNKLNFVPASGDILIWLFHL